MKKLLIPAFLFTCSLCFAQTGASPCKVEFYLLKRVIPNSDSTKGMRAQFNVVLSDLQDTAFIKDTDIISYSISLDTTRAATDIVKISKSAALQLDKLKLPLCCGQQFAIVVNRHICYAGYFWNFVSSWGCDWITAFAKGNAIAILRRLPDYNSKPGDSDARKDKVLLDCLEATNRLIKR
jgi:hypothetical protein